MRTLMALLRVPAPANGVIRGTTALWEGLLLLTTTSCYTTQAVVPKPIEVVPTGSRPTLEYIINSGPARRNKEILEHWQDQGYIASATPVKSSRCTGTADYNLRVDGSEQTGAVYREDIFVLTLGLIPRTTIYRLEVRYSLENVRTGELFTAEVAGSVAETFQLFLFLAIPWQNQGYSARSRAMADHLYQQLKDAGAFGPDLEDLPPLVLEEEDGGPDPPSDFLAD